PGFIRNMETLRQKGFDPVICISVNDPFVIDAWDSSSKAGDAGITMLADPEGTFTQVIGMECSLPPAGLFGRSRRYTMVVDSGRITVLNLEESLGSCEIAAAEHLLSAL
ncbi:MAG: redoxin family protein, partial [Rhodobacteraceae bacterium]|nr:redoxin family protein [Paracoccaceae bacterium]